MVKVLIVDDSPVVRKVLGRELSKDAGIEVVGTAPNPFVARDRILELRPDVVSLDIDMPRMDGLTFLKRLMRYHPIPVVIVSSLTESGSGLALEALESGAIDVLEKPRGDGYEIGEMAEELGRRLKAAARADLTRRRRRDMDTLKQLPPREEAAERICVIGASTGGTTVIERLLRVMPPDGPAIVIAQHMPERVTRQFARRLNSLSAYTVLEAEGGEPITPGQALVAPGGKHLLIRDTGGSLRARVKDGPKVNNCRPSVDVLFRSAAKALGGKALGVLLTGMGSDGARGLLELRQAGAPTLVQDEASCVVFGMPKAAVDLGAACEVLAVEQIAARILDYASDEGSADVEVDEAGGAEE